MSSPSAACASFSSSSDGAWLGRPAHLRPPHPAPPPSPPAKSAGEKALDWKALPKKGRDVARRDTQAPPTPEPTTPPPVHYPTINPLFSRSYRNLSSARLESTPRERKRCSKEGHQVCEKCGLTRHMLFPGTAEREIETRCCECQLVGQHWQPVTILNPHREMDEERRDHE